MTTSDGNHVCSGCVGESYLANRVVEEGIQALCSYCGETREALTLEDLADRIHHAMQQHFNLTPDYPSEPYEYFLADEGRWEQRGDPAEYVIADITGLSDEIAADVTATLSDLHSYQARKQASDDPYGSEALYEASGPNEKAFRFAWIEFNADIRSRARFFSAGAKEKLDIVFGDLSAHKTYRGKPVICEIGLGTTHPYVWRARQAQSTNELETMLKSLTREIGPPPSKTTRGGRMNAPGISVFYGALDEDTCIAEVRALVGSQVVVAKFEPIRTLHLLDFDALAELDAGGSYFDVDYADRRGRAAFFKWLVSEIGRPVMPQEEAFEHISTQAMAEYLSNKVDPPLDGIIFRSAQTGGVGRNVVLFNHACRIEPYDLPQEDGLQIFIRPPAIHAEDEGGEGGEIDFVETVAPNLAEYASPDGTHALIMFDFDYEPPPSGEPTLRLSLEDIAVLDIQGVRYDHKRRAISRYQVP